jgi:UDPglucose 6-dehydrogenase
MKPTASNRPNNIQGISVVGLGKLGAPLAICFAYKGYQVVGVDFDRSKIRLISEGIPPVFEPGLEELLQSVQGRLVATDDYEEAIKNSEVTFILVPTPSDAEGGFSLRYVIPACEGIGRVLREKSTFHLVVLTSTVLPSTTENEVKPVLEACSGKRCGVDFGLCYNPEFVSLGSVIKDLLRPDFVLIGESDSFSGDTLVSLYEHLCDNNPPIARMNFVNAELTKLSVNTFVTTKIAFANMLARMCEQLPGANVDVVTSALGKDSRIGGKYLKGAIGYGGPCFPRDNSALAFLGRRIGSEATLAEATDGANRQEVRRLAELVKFKLLKDGVVGILGLTYKPNTDVVEESQGLLLAQLLSAEGFSVAVYDPAGMKNARRVLDGSVIFAGSTHECIQSADVVVLATPWEEFKRLPPEWLSRHSTRRTLVDCWRVLDPKRYNGVVDYLPLGVGPYVAPIK